MVGTIIPMVHGDGKYGAQDVVCWIYCLACTLGASVFGLLVVLLGQKATSRLNESKSLSLELFVAAVLAGLYSLHELRIWTLPAPQIRRQVPKAWSIRYSPMSCAALYGICLGFGIGTRVPFTTFYVLTVLVFFKHSYFGVVSFAILGLARGGTLLAFRRGPCAAERIPSISYWKPVVALLNGLLLAAFFSMSLLFWVRGLK